MPVQLSGSLLMSGSITATGLISAQGGISSVGAQQITDLSNAISFTSTASLYTNGGARITKDLYVSGTSYFNNVTIYGTQSVQYITSSQLNIGTNIITVNTDTPTVRYGGIAVYDSGSTGLTGSLLWDSEANHWIYTNPSGSTYSGGMMISGPRSSARGCEQGTTSCALMMGQGGDHITSSGIFHYGNATCFYGNSTITSTGVGCFAGTICAPTVLSSGTICSTGNTCFGGTVILAGDVGIGTASPTVKLHVSGSGTTYGKIEGVGNNTTGLLTKNGGREYFTGTYYNVTDSWEVADITAGGLTRLAINTSGNVGIGCNTPTNSRLLVAGTHASGNSILGVVPVSNNVATIGLYNSSGVRTALFYSDTGFVTVETDTDPLLLRTAGTNRLSLSSTGIACFACQTCTPALDIMPSGIGVSTLGGIMRVVTGGTAVGIGVGQSNTNRYTQISANDLLVYNDDFFIATRCAFPLSIGTCYTSRLTFAATGIACFSCQVCAPAFVGGTVSGTTGTFSAKLTVSQASTDFVAEFTNTANSTPYGLRVKDAGTPVNNYPLLSVTNNAGSVEYFRVNSGTGMTTFTGVICSACRICSPSLTTGILRLSDEATYGLTICKGANSYPVIFADGAQSIGIITAQSGVSYGERLRIFHTGEACFACTVCLPVAIVSGCVGINTTAPDSLLHVLNCSNTPYSDANALASGQWFRISNPSTCTGATSGLLFVAQGPSGGNGIATINGVTTSCGSMAITFGTRDASGNVTERMRIASNGKVGIGETTPDNTYQGLTIKGSDPSLRLKTTGVSGWTWVEFVNCSGTNNFSMGVNQTQPQFVIKAGAGMDSPHFSLGSTGVTCFACRVCMPVLLASGCVGIGTTSPGYKLDVQGVGRFQNSDGSDLIRYTATGVNTEFATKIVSGANDVLVFRRQHSTQGALDIMALGYNGNVGIGTTSPTATLDIGSAKTLSGTDPISVYTDVRVQSAVTGGLIGYNLRMVGLSPAVGSYTIANMYGLKTNTPVVQPNVTVTNSYGVYIGRTDDPSSGGVVTNKYALVTEAAAGNVGIGTTTPAEKFVVSETTNPSQITLKQETNFNLGIIGQLNYIGGGIGSKSAMIESNRVGSSATNAYRGGDLRFYTKVDDTFDCLVERMRITSGGDVLVGATSRVTGLSGYTQFEVSAVEGGITINSNCTTTERYSRLMFTKSGATGNEGLIRYNVNDYHMSLWTNANERLRITCAGNVGINNSSPSYRLDICTAQSIRVIGSSTGYTQGSIIFQSSTLDTPEARGLGVYAFNEGTDATWFYGTAYNAADTFVVNRKAGTTYQDSAASVGESSTFLSINNTGRVGLGTTNVSTEANLFLGAQGTIEGGQLVLQKGTSCSCATHLDNYNDSFRVLVGTDTGSTGVNMLIDHKTGNACFYGTVSAFQFRNTGIYAGIYCDVPTVCSGYVQYDMVSTNNANLYQVYVATNPNPGGSSTYIDYYYGKIIIGNGYDGANLKTYMTYCPESILPRSLYGSGGGNVAVCVCLVQGGSEYTCVNTGTNYCVRVKIGGNGNYTAVNLVKLL